MSFQSKKINFKNKYYCVKNVKLKSEKLPVIIDWTDYRFIKDSSYGSESGFSVYNLIKSYKCYNSYIESGVHYVELFKNQMAYSLNNSIDKLVCFNTSVGYNLLLQALYRAGSLISWPWPLILKLI